MKARTYIAIDLKSFYASVECVDRGLDPLDTNLVVADKSRTEKTICLAVSPSLKSYGIPGRARLFEVKHVPADKDGVRIAELDEMTYRKTLWSHRPLTDFWRVGRSYSNKLERHGLYTMGDIARCSIENGSLYNEDLLYRMFGINAELLIDHAWGWEPCTIADIKAYKPQANSLGSGQVLQEPYPYKKAKLVVTEMADALALDLVAKGLVTNQIVMTVGYDCDNENYDGEFTYDHYGRKIPKHAHGTFNLDEYSSSGKYLRYAATELFDRIVNKKLNIRRLYITATKVVREEDAPQGGTEQLDLFTNYEEETARRELFENECEKEKKRQKAVLALREKYGKNAVLKAASLEDGATARERNNQIGGHKA